MKLVHTSQEQSRQTATASLSAAHAWLALQFDSALEGASDALHAASQGEDSLARSHAWRAASLVQGLQMTLDRQRGGELAQQLSELFDYVQRRLRCAAGQGAPAAYRESLSLLGDVCQAWRSEPSLVPTQRPGAPARLH